MDLEEAVDVPGQSPAAAESSEVAQAGANAGGAEPGADIAGGAGEEEARAVERAPGWVPGRRWEEMNETRLNRLMELDPEAPGVGTGGSR